MLPRVLAHDPGTASYHVYLLFYVAGFLTAQGSGGQFPCPCFEGTTQTAHISPPYVAVEPGWVAPWPDFVEDHFPKNFSLLTILKILRKSEETKK